MGPKRRSRVKRVHITKENKKYVKIPLPPPPPPPPPPPLIATRQSRRLLKLPVVANNEENNSSSSSSTTTRRQPPPPPPPTLRGQNESAASRIHGNVGYPTSVKVLLQRHKKLVQFEPAEATRDVFKFTSGKRSGSLLQTHLRFRFDYVEVQKHLLTVFSRLFALQGDNRDAFEVVITFNAILHCKDSGTYSVFYGTDHRENNRMGAANELSYGNCYLIRNLEDVVNKLPVTFDHDDLLRRHQNAFPNSNVSVFKFLNLIYLIYQFRN